MAFKKLRGIKLAHKKSTAEALPLRMPPPETVCIPMSMNIGAPAVKCVKIGEGVKVGQVIAKAGGYVSAPVHASVSGTVKRFVSLTLSSGNKTEGIVIESDGLMETDHNLTPPEITDFASFIEAVQNSGVVGLGGAGFPTSVKLNVKDISAVEEIVINGAECEPYITSDTRTFYDRQEELVYGIKLLQRFYSPNKIIFGIENNKPGAIEITKKLFEDMDNVTVHSLPHEYPQGGEKVIIYSATGKIVPEGKLPYDVGVIVLNVTTVAAVARYIMTGMPLTEKCVTVDGSSVREPKNVIAPIGASVYDVFQFAGGFKEEPKKLIMGGPMMGVALIDQEFPVLKNTNALLAFNEKEGSIPEESPCINCGSCVSKCPLRLNPPAFAKALKMKDGQALEKYKVNLCMECGVCAYVCPAKRYLVQRNRNAKRFLRDYKEANKNG